MEFSVPKFIEKKTKIAGPFTFGQLVIVVTAGATIFFLYFLVPFATFIIAAAFLLTVAGFLAFGKINQTPVPVVIKNFFIFFLNPKIYLWKRKTAPYKIIETKKIEVKKEEEEEKSPLKVTERSRLKELSTRIEMKNR